MAERRSLGDAMEMTPEKLAFIQGNGGEVSPKAAEPPKPLRETIEVCADVEDMATSTIREARPRSTKRQNRRASTQAAGASEVLDQVLVPVTVRLPHRMAQSLRRAYLEQRLKHAKPDTQQEIVEEALGDWLSQQGYLG